MIYYPLQFLMMAGISDVLLFPTGRHRGFSALAKDGSQLGCRFNMLFSQGRKDWHRHSLSGNFVGKEKVALILGDNIFYGSGLGTFSNIHRS